LPLAPSAAAFSSASGFAQVDVGTRALFDNTQFSKMLRRVFPFFSEYFRCYKNTAALKNRPSRALTHTGITLTLRRIATKSHKNKKNKKDDRQLKTVSYLCCMKEESVCRGGKPEISQAQRLLSV
jgi:hypothetical protein